jgi:hypothetical protein
VFEKQKVLPCFAPSVFWGISHLNPCSHMDLLHGFSVKCSSLVHTLNHTELYFVLKEKYPSLLHTLCVRVHLLEHFPPQSCSHTEVILGFLAKCSSLLRILSQTELYFVLQAKWSPLLCTLHLLEHLTPQSVQSHGTAWMRHSLAFTQPCPSALLLHTTFHTHTTVSHNICTHSHLVYATCNDALIGL